MNLLFLDTETTGIKDARLAQVAYIHAPSGVEFTGMFKPPIPIEDGAAAVTGITNEMVASCEPWEGSSAFLEVDSLLKGGAVLVAHNAKFDIGVLKRSGLEVSAYICTMKIARHLRPMAVNHKLESLFAELELELPEGREAKAHDALGDILMMRALLRHFVLEHVYQNPSASVGSTIQYFIDFCNNPLLKTMPFGKHKGRPMAQLPKDYVMWLREKPEMDDEVIFSLNHYFPVAL